MNKSTVVVVCLLLLVGRGRGSPVAENPEDQMKAAVLLGFIRYTEWSAPLSESRSIVVAVSGRPAFAGTLKLAFEGKTAGNRTISVVELHPAVDIATCHIIYFAAGKSADAQLLTKLRALRTGALTVGETQSFLDSGGAVRLLLAEGRMSFEVRRDVLEHSGVNISSKLLRFGHIQARPGGRRP